MSWSQALRDNYAKIGPIVRANPELGMTGPHHVGAEIDLEFQASYNAAWRTYSKGLLLVALGAFVAAGYQKQTGGSMAVPLYVAGAASMGSFLSEAMAHSVASRALTETHPALRPLVGKTGGWWPVDAQDLGPIALPGGRVIEPADVKPVPKNDVVTFPRYVRTESGA